MAINIPLPEAAGDDFLKGLSVGSDLFHKMMLSRYYSPFRPSGDVANAIYVENLRNRFGENDPRYLSAKNALDLMQQNRESLIGYRGIQGALAPYRVTSPEGKLLREARGEGALDIVAPSRNGTSEGSAYSEGYMPPGAVRRHGDQYYDADGNPVYPEEAELNRIQREQMLYPEEEAVQGEPSEYDKEAAQYYERILGKKATDPDARKRYLFAKNIDKTRAFINPDHLLAYSGLKGSIDRLNDEYKAQQSGEPPEKLKNFYSSLTAAQTLAKQVRQFYGDSIQPQMEKKLEALTNPATWFKNPKIARENFDTFNKILDAETQTYRTAGTSPVKLQKRSTPSLKQTYRDSDLVIVEGPNGKETMTYAKAKSLGAI